MKKTTRCFVISLIVLILCSLLNWGIVSGWGNVKIQRINIIGDDGLSYSALMYVPKNATNETPAPAVLMVHGAAGNARNHEAWSLEFSRRGFVCLAIDWNGSGESEYNSTAKAENGVPDLFMEYLISCPVVDSSAIATSGHSMGCTPAIKTAEKYGAAVCLATSPAGPFGNSLFSGNLLMCLGGCDAIASETAKTRFGENAVNSGLLQEGELFECDKIYGSFEEGNAHLYTFIENQIHEGVFTNSKTISAIVDFTQKAVTAPNNIDAGDMIWYWKDVVGFIGMFAFVGFLLTLATLLMDSVPAFAEIRQPLPENIGLRGPGLAISIIAALVFPLLCMKTGTFGLITKLGMQNFPLLGMGRANNATSLLLGITLFGIVMLLVFWFTDAKKHQATIRELGLTSEGKSGMDWPLIGKAFLLAAIVVITGWTCLSVQTSVLGTDFYCLYFGYKPVAVTKFVHYIPYLVIYILCFIVSSISINVERRLPSTGKESLDTVIAMVFNGLLASCALVVMIIIQNAAQLNAQGSINGQALSGWTIDITRLWGMPMGMFLGTSGSTYCYRRTGNIWLGAFLMGMVCALGCVLYGQYTIPV